MSIVRIDPEGWRNAEHIAIIVVVDLVPIQSHFRTRRPQAQHKTATGFKHGHVEVLRASPAAASAAASSASTVRAAWAAPGSRGEIQNEIVPLPRARAVQQG